MGGAFQLGEFSPVGTQVGYATTAASGATWGLQNNSNTNLPLQIDPNTGEVTLSGPIDFESGITNYSYRVTATKNGEERLTAPITLRVQNETYSGFGMQSNNARDGIFFKSAVDDGQLGANENRVAYFVAHDIVDKSADERKLFALSNGLPAGTTFDCSINAMTSFCGNISVDAQGNMSVVSNNNSFFIPITTK